jgi:hypothetical protein
LNNPRALPISATHREWSFGSDQPAVLGKVVPERGCGHLATKEVYRDCSTQFPDGRRHACLRTRRRSHFEFDACSNPRSYRRGASIRVCSALVGSFRSEKARAASGFRPFATGNCNEHEFGGTQWGRWKPMDCGSHQERHKARSTDRCSDAAWLLGNAKSSWRPRKAGRHVRSRRSSSKHGQWAGLDQRGTGGRLNAQDQESDRPRQPRQCSHDMYEAGNYSSVTRPGRFCEMRCIALCRAIALIGGARCAVPPRTGTVSPPVGGRVQTARPFSGAPTRRPYAIG